MKLNCTKAIQIIFKEYEDRLPTVGWKFEKDDTLYGDYIELKKDAKPADIAEAVASMMEAALAKYDEIGGNTKMDYKQRG